MCAFENVNDPWTLCFQIISLHFIVLSLVDKPCMKLRTNFPSSDRNKKSDDNMMRHLNALHCYGGMSLSNLVDLLLLLS